MNKKKTDFVVVGFALFSMFFGAGNLIFPPLLGRNLGPAYIAGIIGFIITGVGIPLLGLLASIRIDGQFELLAENVGRKFSTIYAIILFILIGPLLAIPRTAATTFEIAVLPNFPNMNPLIMILIFFAINLIFVLKPSKVIDSLGKFLTPILILILFTLVFKGVLHPLSDLSKQVIPNALSSSLLEGYQTMDAIASIIFASVILGSIKAKGYKGKAVKKVTIKASLVAVGGLAIIYGGLTFLGARTGALATDLTKSELLIYLSRNILGTIGTTAIGVSMALACLTTSIGLLSAGGSFFERVSKGKFKYTFNVLAMTVVSIFIANMGLEAIVSLSSTLLSVIYPVTIVLILLNLFHNYIPKKASYKYTVYTTLFISIFALLGSKIPAVGHIVQLLPLSKLGFEWIIPALLAFVLSTLLCKSEKSSSHNVVNFEDEIIITEETEEISC